jgi:hypothetical protein
MQPKLILSPSHLAHRLGVDRRAVLRRLAKLEIIPGFITPAGEAFFDEDVLHRLEAAELGDVPQETAPQESSI